MKTLSIVSALIGAAVALSSSAAFASTESVSAAACAQAFAEQLSPADGATPSFKLDYQKQASGSTTAEFYTTRYTFDLSARDPKSSAGIARATCVTSRNGRVISLTSLPARSEESKLAATF